MQSMNIPPLALFLRNIVIKNIEKYQSSSLFKRFNDYLEKYNINAKYSIQAFGRDINKHEGIEKTKSNIINNVFDIKKLKEYLIKKEIIHLMIKLILLMIKSLILIYKRKKKNIYIG